MSKFDTAGTGTERRELDRDVLDRDALHRIAGLEQQCAKLRARWLMTVIGAGALGVGAVLGGLGNSGGGQPAEKLNRVDDVVAYTATDGTIYKIFESGKIEYLRVDENPPRTADGVYDWGDVQIDLRYTLPDRP